MSRLNLQDKISGSQVSGDFLAMFQPANQRSSGSNWLPCRLISERYGVSESTKCETPKSRYLPSDRATSAGTHQPRRACTAATKFPGGGVEVVIEHVAALMQSEQPLLPDGGRAPVLVPVRTLDTGHFGGLGFGV